jgi:hypothetical protein
MHRPLICVVLLGLCACNQGTKPGSLVGSYAVHGVLVENTCGQSALPTANPLDFVVELRSDTGIAYWLPTKAASTSGTLNDSGGFRFTMSETQVVQGSPAPRQEEPSDFLSTEPDFDLKQRQARPCALTRKQTVSGKVMRRIEDGVVNETPASGDRDAAVEDSDTAGSDLSAEHMIEVAPATGSECSAALAALGGAFLALPCQARYVLTGRLDTSGAVFPSDAGDSDAAD